MPELVTFRGSPIKRRYRVPGGLRLQLYHPIRGMRGARLIVTEEEWQQDGRVEFFSKDQMPNFRLLASQA